MNEIAWTRKITREMRETGAMVVPYVGNARQQAGFPDRIVLSQIVGAIVLIEFKGMHTRITPAQQTFGYEANRLAPGSCYLARQPDTLEHAGVKYEFNGTGHGLLLLIRNLNHALRA